MKLEIESGISITLTQEQIDSIEAQKNPKLNANTIDYKSALELLTKNGIDPDPKGLYNGQLLQLVTIIKAINFIDNGNKEWIIDFDNRNQTKYYPWFEKKSSGWLLYVVSASNCLSDMPAGLFYCNRDTVKIISERYLNTLYKTYLG